MPVVEPQPDTLVAAGAMPTFAAALEAAPLQIGGVSAATTEDLADRARAEATARAVESDLVNPTGTWWSPGVALVLGFAALAWQLVSFYAREQLPVVETSGTQLTNFDRVVGAVPLAGSSLGPALGVLLAAGAIGIVLYGSRRGLREPALQIGISVVAALSLLVVIVLPKVLG